MGAFTKTLIVDSSYQEVVGQYYQTIKSCGLFKDIKLIKKIDNL